MSDVEAVEEEESSDQGALASADFAILAIREQARVAFSSRGQLGVEIAREFAVRWKALKMYVPAGNSRFDKT